MKQPDKARAGKKGGLKHVPKGFAMANGEDKSAQSRRGALARWGKEKEIHLKIKYLPSEEEKIIAYARELAKDGVTDSGHDLEDALLAVVSFNPLMAELRLDLDARIADDAGNIFGAKIERPDEEKKEEIDYDDYVLAKKVAAVFIGDQLGMSPTTVEKKHLSQTPEELGTLWYRVVSITRQLLHASHEEQWRSKWSVDK